MEDIEDVVMGRGARLKASFPDALIAQDGPLLTFDVNKLCEGMGLPKSVAKEGGRPSKAAIYHSKVRLWKMLFRSVPLGLHLHLLWHRYEPDWLRMLFLSMKQFVKQ